MINCDIILGSSYCWYRSLQSNLITSIASGAFTGLGSLTYLYVNIRCHVIRFIPSHCSHRSIESNRIISIASGAFTGLGKLTRLYAAIDSHVSFAWFHRTARAGICSTTQYHHLSDSFAELRSLTQLYVTTHCRMSASEGNMFIVKGTWTGTRSHRLRMLRSLDLETWLYCM